MKEVNLIIPVNKIINLKEIADTIGDKLKYTDYKFFVNIVTNKRQNPVDLPENYTVTEIQEENTDKMINYAMTTFTCQYNVVINLKNNNWEHYLNKMLENLDNGNEIVRISEMSVPSNVFSGMKNFLIRLYYIILNFCAKAINLHPLIIVKNDFQGYSDNVINVFRHLPGNITEMRNCNGLVAFNQKVLFLKKPKNSHTIEHTEKQKMSKYSVYSIVFLIATLLFIVFDLFVMLPAFLNLNALFRFVLFTVLVTGLLLVFSVYFNFYDKLKDYISDRDA